MPFLHFRAFSQKLDGTNQLPKAGFDRIALKVILPLFSNFDTSCPFIQNLFSNFSSILA